MIQEWPGPPSGKRITDIPIGGRPLGNIYLVTGAAGFIGSHVCEALLAQGDAVIGLDNLNDYYAPARKRANVAEIIASAAPASQFTLIEGDIRDGPLVNDLFSRHRFSAVIHLAAMAGVRASVAAPHLYMDVNVAGTLTLLEAARNHQTGAFVFASTSSVYGSTSAIPFREGDSCDRILSPYSASKRAVELLGYTYHHLHGLSFTALRFFTVYGPRGRPDMMPYKVADNISFGREVPLYNGGQMQRDWTFVTDIAQGVVAAARRPLGYEVINLGRGESVLLGDFVALLEAHAGRRASLTPAPRPASDVPATWADVSKARRLLGYQPHTSVQEGVAAFWRWYQRAALAAHCSPSCMAESVTVPA
jgi:UDP-glucuronate 4-epimerase